jgi:hypothetical protein
MCVNPNRAVSVGYYELHNGLWIDGCILVLFAIHSSSALRIVFYGSNLDCASNDDQYLQ